MLAYVIVLLLCCIASLVDRLPNNWLIDWFFINHDNFPVYVAKIYLHLQSGEHLIVLSHTAYVMFIEIIEKFAFRR